MGIGIVLIFWIIVLIFIALILTPFIKKNGFINSFLQIFTTLVAFFVIFTIVSTVGQAFMGKRSGGFGDSRYYEVQNNYMIEWIDTWNNAILTDGNRTAAVNSKSFSESFKFFIYNDLIVVKKSTMPNKLLIINTVKKSEELKTEEWLVENNLSKQEFMSPYGYIERESEKLENLLPIFISFLIALYGAYFFNRKYYNRNKK